jgi:hypothetical protein
MADIETKTGPVVLAAQDAKDEKEVHDNSATQSLGEEAREIDLVVAKRVLRKIDWFLMPAMVLGESSTVLRQLE